MAGAVVTALVASTTATASPAAAAPTPTGSQGARAHRAALLLQAAALTDRLERSEADVVAAQLRRARQAGRVATAAARVRERAVTAYMRGTGASVAALVTPQVYLEVVAEKEREVIDGYRSALAGAGAEQRRAEEARGDLRALRAELSRVEAALDVTIAADDARRADERRRSDEARRAAMARRAAAVAATRGRALVTAGATAPGGYAPVPLDPAALLDRHRAATARQLDLMRRIPFGPVSALGPLPGGLVTTGQRVEGNASWYGPGFNGRPTASGAIYDQEAWTVASRDLPLGTLLAVSRGARRVLLLVNDRGPYVEGRVLDLSAAAARELGVGGVGTVSAEVVAAARPGG